MPGPHTGKNWSKAFGPFLTLGLQLALSVVAFTLLGRYLDKKLGTEPWLLILGVGMGITGGFILFFRTVADIEKTERKESKDSVDHK